MPSPNADAVFEDIVTEVSGVVQTFVKEWDPSFYQEEELDDPDFNSKKEALDGNQEALDESYEYHNFLKDKDMGNVPEIAGLLQLSKANHAERISALPEVDQANLFDRAVARAVIQKVADGIPKPSLIGLLELLYKILYGPGVLKPDGTLSLEALIDEASAQLLIIRTELVSWMREHEKLEEDERLLRLNEPEKQDMLSVHLTVISFMSLLYSRLRASRSWRHTDAMQLLGQFGFQITCEIMCLDKDPMLPEDWRVLLIRGALIWLDLSQRFFIVELLKELLKEPSMEFCNSTSGEID